MKHNIKHTKQPIHRLLLIGLVCCAICASITVVAAQEAATLRVQAETPFGTRDTWFTWRVFWPGGAWQAGDQIEVQLPERVVMLNVEASAGDAEVQRPENRIVWRFVGAEQAQTAQTLTLRSRPTSGYDANFIQAEVRLRSAAGAVLSSAQDNIILVESLPSTGQTPVWRLPLILLMGIGGVLLLAASIAGTSAQR